VCVSECDREALLMRSPGPHKGQLRQGKKKSRLGEINDTTKGHPVTCQCWHTIVQLLLYPFTSSALEGGRWLTPGPDWFIPGEVPASILEEAGEILRRRT
jgi:hypothetical protein